MKLKNDQRGIVSLFVTIIMMLVISLIIIGFAQVTRRNQREALDRQLSTQAYYAAESGINAATAFFAKNPTASPPDTLTPGNCTGLIGSYIDSLGNPVTVQAPLNLKPDNTVATTCLMVNSTPATLQASPVTEDSNLIWHVQNNSGLGFTGLTFTWAQSATYSGTNTCASGANSHPLYGTGAGAWNCAFPILRADLVDVNGLGAGNLENNSKVWSVFMVPHGPFSTGATTPVPSAALTTQAKIVQTTCDSATNACAVKLTGLTSSEYYVRVTAIYQNSSNVTLAASDVLNPVGGAKFKNGQAVIDATGKAQDQLRRVQARVPLMVPDSTLPIFGLQSTQDICKLTSGMPGGGAVDTGGCN